jgi:hypothetical protein
MANKTHEERTAAAQRQECRGRYVEYQLIDSEEGEAQAYETAEGEACCRSSTSNTF